MAIVKFTKDGIERANVNRSEFFNATRETLVKAGFEETVWVDYLVGRKEDKTFFVTIKKSRIFVEDSGGFLFSTIKVQRVVDLLAI